MNDHSQWDERFGWVYTGGSELYYRWQIKDAPWWYSAWMEFRVKLWEWQDRFYHSWIYYRIEDCRWRHRDGYPKAWVVKEQEFDPFAEGAWE